MSGGRITGILPIDEFDTTRIGLMMGGMHKSPMLETEAGN
jgi:simple sugar transport system ATP-binding protein